ncbi:hypothetical protein HZA33_00235 [Candidatus Pacearchaeota archaeon]|nr:hypothetical protein [Candidatus Pacearchaeota archaeon]
MVSQDIKKRVAERIQEAEDKRILETALGLVLIKKYERLLSKRRDLGGLGVWDPSRVGNIDDYLMAIMHPHFWINNNAPDPRPTYPRSPYFEENMTYDLSDLKFELNVKIHEIQFSSYAHKFDWGVVSGFPEPRALYIECKISDVIKGRDVFQGQFDEVYFCFNRPIYPPGTFQGFGGSKGEYFASKGHDEVKRDFYKQWAIVGPLGLKVERYIPGKWTKLLAIELKEEASEWRKLSGEKLRKKKNLERECKERDLKERFGFGYKQGNEK